MRFDHVPPEPERLLTIGDVSDNSSAIALQRCGVTKMSVSMPNLDGMEVVRTPDRTLPAGLPFRSREDSTGPATSGGAGGRHARCKHPSHSRADTAWRPGRVGKVGKPSWQAARNVPGRALRSHAPSPSETGRRRNLTATTTPAGQLSDAQPRFARSSTATTRGEAAAAARSGAV